MALPKETGPR